MNKKNIIRLILLLLFAVTMQSFRACNEEEDEFPVEFKNSSNEDIYVYMDPIKKEEIPVMNSKLFITNKRYLMEVSKKHSRGRTLSREDLNQKVLFVMVMEKDRLSHYTIEELEETNYTDSTYVFTLSQLELMNNTIEYKGRHMHPQ